MDLINAIAEYFKCNTSDIEVTSASGKYAWFTVKGRGNFNCKVTRGKFLAKNSIRKD